MIHLFPATFSGQTTKIQARVLKFEVADENRELSKEIGNSPQGTNYLIVAYEMTDMNQLQEIHRNPENGKKMLMKQLHAKIGEYVTKFNIDKDIVMKVLRVKLKARGLIEDSVSELDEVGLAKAVWLTDTELNPSRFDYSQYANKSPSPSPAE